MALWRMAWARSSFKIGRLREPDTRIAEVRVARSLFSMGAGRALGGEANGIGTVLGWPLRLDTLGNPERGSRHRMPELDFLRSVGWDLASVAILLRQWVQVSEVTTGISCVATRGMPSVGCALLIVTLLDVRWRKMGAAKYLSYIPTRKGAEPQLGILAQSYLESTTSTGLLWCNTPHGLWYHCGDLGRRSEVQWLVSRWPQKLRTVTEPQCILCLMCGLCFLCTIRSLCVSCASCVACVFPVQPVITKVKVTNPSQLTTKECTSQPHLMV